MPSHKAHLEVKQLGFIMESPYQADPQKASAAELSREALQQHYQAAALLKLLVPHNGGKMDGSCCKRPAVSPLPLALPGSRRLHGEGVVLFPSEASASGFSAM